MSLVPSSWWFQLTWRAARASWCASSAFFGASASTARRTEAPNWDSELLRRPLQHPLLDLARNLVVEQVAGLHQPPHHRRRDLPRLEHRQRRGEAPHQIGRLHHHCFRRPGGQLQDQGDLFAVPMLGDLTVLVTRRGRIRIDHGQQPRLHRVQPSPVPLHPGEQVQALVMAQTPRIGVAADLLAPYV
jgi:hypothetical protein